MNDLYSNATNNGCFLSESQMEGIRLTSLVLGSFSLLSCALILCLIAILKKFRTSTQRVILYLTVTVTLLSIVYVLHGLQGYGTNHSYCVVTGFLDELVAWMLVMAILCLNVDLTIKVVTQKYSTEKYEIAYLLLIFIFPFTFNWIPFIHQEYGRAGAYCWIRHYNYDSGNCSDVEKLGVAFQFALFWGPFMLVVFISSVLYTFALCKVRSRKSAYSPIYDPIEQANNNFLHSEIRQYMIYPVVLIVLNMLAFISRIVDAAKPETIYFPLQVLHIVCISMQGLPMAVVFVLDKDTRHDLSSWHTFRSALYSCFCSYRMPTVTEYSRMDINTTSDSIKESQTKTI